MKIVVTCKEVRKFERKVDVWALYFNPQDGAFSMSYCIGDMWDVELKCPLKICPINLKFSGSTVEVRFDRQVEAEDFADWLIEGEKKVQHGSTTMRG